MGDDGKPSLNLIIDPGAIHRAVDILRDQIKDVQPDYAAVASKWSDAFAAKSAKLDVRGRIESAITQDGIVYIMTDMGDCYSVRLEDEVPVTVLVSRGTGKWPGDVE